jgi:hypothetical protein
MVRINEYKNHHFITHNLLLRSFTKQQLEKRGGVISQNISVFQEISMSLLVSADELLDIVSSTIRVASFIAKLWQF